MAISKRLRFEILRRDGYRCRYCGAAAPDTPLTVDHVTPTALGGSDDPGNLATACEPCNSGKTSTPPDAAVVGDVEGSALRWSAAMQRAASIASDDRARRDHRRAMFLAFWKEWTWEDSLGRRREFPLPRDWEESIDQFCAGGLEHADIAECIAVTMRSSKRLRDEFRYFAGVCWRTLEQRQKTARELVEADDEEWP